MKQIKTLFCFDDGNTKRKIAIVQKLIIENSRSLTKQKYISGFVKGNERFFVL